MSLLEIPSRKLWTRASDLYDVELSSENVDGWSQKNFITIEHQLEREQTLVDPALRQDWESRCLSEMPLCRAWLTITPPRGFIIAEAGEVRIVDKYHRVIGSGSRHIFALGIDDKIICFTFGQFFDKQFGLPQDYPFTPGERIQKYKVMAPHLITIYEKLGIARLYGGVEEIIEALGLWYKAA